MNSVQREQKLLDNGWLRREGLTLNDTPFVSYSGEGVVVTAMPGGVMVASIMCFLPQGWQEIMRMADEDRERFLARKSEIPVPSWGWDLNGRV